MNPKVFVSHASEDKERFVIDFAKRLRENGVDAWLDKWEMLPGDSLVDKIFEEGLKDAQAVIIVLSNHSIKKPWVIEELNTSIVAKLSRGTKIIPIVLDECEVPQSLSSTLWEPIYDLKSYDQNFKRVLSSIYGVVDKPALGNAPIHTTSVYHEIGGLTKADNLVLKASCEYAIKNNDTVINPELLFGDGKDLGLSQAEIVDCIEVLEKNGHISVSRYLGGGGDSYSCHFRVNTYGLDNYARSYIDDYDEIFKNIVSLIVNKNINSNSGIEKNIDKPALIIDHILNSLEKNGHVKLSKSIGGRVQVYNVSASLRRSMM